MTATLATVRKSYALALLAATQFVVILDASIVNVALPSIDKRFGVGSAGTLAWVVNGYLLTYGGFLLLAGRISDRVGRRLTFMAGAALFGAASLLAGLSNSFGMLVAARFVQGLGGALISSAALALVTVIFAEGPERNKALGVWGSVAGLGGAAGLILGGVLTEELGWQWVFIVNVPLVAVALALSRGILPESRSDAVPASEDVAGAVSIVAGLAALVYAFVEAGNEGWGSWQTVGFGIAGAVLLAVFVAVEKLSRSPMVDFGIFKLRTVLAANATGVIAYLAVLSFWFFLALYLQQVQGYSALKAGMVSVPVNVAVIGAASVTGRVVAVVGYKPALVASLAAIAGGFLWFSFLSSDGSYAADVLGPLILFGLGAGGAFVTITIAAVGGVPHEQAGLASGLLNTTIQVSSAIGLAILTTVSTSRTAHALAGGASGRTALTQGYHVALLVAAAVALAAAITASFAFSGRANRQFVEMVKATKQQADEQPVPVRG